MKCCRCCWETNPPQFFFFHFENNYCSQSKIVVHLFSYSPLEFCWKTRFEASRAVFWPLSGCKEIKHTTKPLTLPALLISLGRKQSFDGFNSDTAALTISFRFLSSPFLSLFLPRFLFCRAFTTVAEFSLAAKVSGEASRMKEKVGG